MKIDKSTKVSVVMRTSGDRVKYIKFDDKVILGKTIAINFGKGRKKGYCDWICDYVKH